MQPYMDTNFTRERVADLIDRGLTVREIAQLLGISTQAVYGHLRKLGIAPPTRTQESAQ